MAEPESKRVDNWKFACSSRICKDFAFEILAAYGANIPNKVVLEHITKLTTAKDSPMKKFNPIIRNPAIKILLDEANKQESKAEGGDNFVIIFCGMLLKAAEELLVDGISHNEVLEGYNLVLNIIQKKFHDFGIEHEREIESSIPSSFSFPDIQPQFRRLMKKLDQVLIAIYDCEFFGENDQHKLLMDVVKKSGAKVIVTMGFDVAARKSLREKELLGVSLDSKLDLNRVCQAFNITPLNVNQLPDKKRLGLAGSVITDIVHYTLIAVFVIRKNSGNEMVVVQEAQNLVEEFESDFKPIRTPLESILASEIRQNADKLPPLNSSVAEKFADALDSLAKFIPENDGVTEFELMPDLRPKKKEEDSIFLVDIEKNIQNKLLSKCHGIKHSVSAVAKILKFDQN